MTELGPDRFLITSSISPQMPQKDVKMSVTINNLDAEEVSDLRDFLNTQRALKRNRQEEGSASEAGLPYERTANHDVDVDNGSGSSNGDADKPSWIGTMIKAPAGERGRGTNAHGRLGYKNEDILRLAGITPQKWAQYMSTAHRLIDHHFDIMKNWTTNSQNDPDAWRVIVSEMQKLHPRFLYHENDWIIRHMAISHLANMNKKFNKMQDDPDVEVHRRYWAEEALATNTPYPTYARGPTSQWISRAPTRVVPPARKRPSTHKKPPSIPHSVDLLIDSEPEIDPELSDLCDDEPPNKRQKQSAQPQLYPQCQCRRVNNPRNPYSDSLGRPLHKRRRSND